MIQKYLQQYKLGTDFYLYFFSFVINFFGTGVQGIALPWLLLERTGSSVSVGLLLTVRAVPGILIAPFAGYLADSFNKKKICYIINFFQGSSVLCVIVLSKFFVDHIAIFYLMAFLVAIGNAVFLPTTKSLIQVIMQKEELLKANSLTESCMQMGMIIGTGIGGYLVYQYGALNVLMIDSFTFFVSGLLILMMRYSVRAGRTEKMKPLFLRSQLDMLNYIRRDYYVLGLIGFLMIPTFSIQVNNVLVGAFTMNTLHLDASAYGRMNVCYAIGAMITGFTIPHFSEKIMNKSIVVFCFLFILALSEFLFGLSNELILAMITSFFIGVGISSSRTWLTTRIMQDTDNHFAGRVHSLAGLLSSFITLLIGLSIGGFAELLGYRTVYYALGVFIFTFALLALYFFSRSRLHTIHSPSQIGCKEIKK